MGIPGHPSISSISQHSSCYFFAEYLPVLQCIIWSVHHWRGLIGGQTPGPLRFRISVKMSFILELAHKLVQDRQSQASDLHLVRAVKYQSVQTGKAVFGEGLTVASTLQAQDQLVVAQVLLVGLATVVVLSIVGGLYAPDTWYFCLPRFILLTFDQGVVPVTLAEFTLASTSGQTFYDISLVDGYNLPLGIIARDSNIPPNMANPICIGTASLLDESNAAFRSDFGTNASYPIPLDTSETWDDVQRWCPWDLQLNPPSKPGDGVYPYPDDNIKRPYFNPCYSACAKYGKPSDCCTGSYNSPTVCKASLYSSHAKKVCPDAYSFGT